jgi:hypothetical protein
MQKLVDRCVLWNNSVYTEWACRLLISVAIVLPVLPVIRDGYEGYQLVMAGILVIACWFYFFKLRLLAIPVLLLGIVLHILYTSS